ncbi:MAG: hypothetical protein NFCOHLIN_02459 [Gammaproteobacteria bacterium]|nr:hypothetical protein [Gammaproteobacteria bacterium]
MPAHPRITLHWLLRSVPILGAVVLCAGCATTMSDRPPACSFSGPDDVSSASVQQTRLQMLARRLLALGPNVDPAEARRVAATALQTSLAQRRDYGVTGSAISHNLAVASGEKRRGLCVHWTRDLLDALRALDLRTLTLYWGIANEGNVLSEHSTVVVAARGASFHEGLVLDGWRYSGCLYWGAVVADKYRWLEAAHYSQLQNRR